MGHLAATDMLNHADRETALRWHLTSNHYPPVPTSMIPVCTAAIEASENGDHFAESNLPEGVSWKGQDTAPAWAIVEGHHLHAFIASEED